MSFIAATLDRWFPTKCREGMYGCPCGAVRAKIRVPASSYILVDHTCALCHCKDCVGFASACCPGGNNKYNVLTSNHATLMVQLYKSDISIIKGQEKIKSIQLYEKSMMFRIYCGECGTPLGAELGPGPICIIYDKLLVDYSIVFLPRLVLGFGYADKEKVRPYGPDATVRQGILDVWFMMKVIPRMILGLLFGKNHGGFLQMNYNNIPVGMEHIAVDKGKDQ